MPAADDLTPQMRRRPPGGLRFGQGTIREWNSDTFANRIEWRGVTLEDLPALNSIEARFYQVGDEVALVGTDPQGKQGSGSWWVWGLISSTDQAEQLISAVTERILLPGKVELFAGPASAVPEGWLVCDGSAVSRTEFARLFTAVGTTWGAGNGTTTFNLPDLRGRTLIGAGSGFTLADIGGSSSHSHSNPRTGNGGSHSHGSAGGHNHGGDTGGPSALTTSEIGGVQQPTINHTHPITSSGSHSHGSVGSHDHFVGSTGSENHLPPHAVVTPIIRY